MIARYTSLRVFAYFMAVTIFYAIAAQLAKSQGGLAVFEEHGFAEQVQFGSMVLSSFMLITLGASHVQLRGLLTLSGALGLCAAVRELNNTVFYRKVFINGAASWIAGILLMGFIIFKFRRGLWQQLDAFLKLPAASILAAGFVVVIGWAQVFAQSSIFSSKEADRIVEEGLESAGYLLIFFGVVELFFNLRESRTGQRP